MQASDWNFQSAVPGTGWPALQAPQNALALSLLFQLEQSQWFAPARLRELQAGQLERVLRHAHASVPWYRERWRGAYDPAKPFSWEAFAALPLLGRRDLQAHFAELKSESVPPPHGKAAVHRTSGSTGTPVKFLTNGMTSFFWRVLTLREHHWHRRDLSAKLAVIRIGVDEPQESPRWGNATTGIVHTGPVVAFPVMREVDAQLDWLAVQDPAYLLTYPSNVGELARRSMARGIALPSLRQVRTVGEVLDPQVRDLVRAAWNVPAKDFYSSEEVGYLALQCPDFEHYHVQSESLVVEVLDDAGRACAPGEVGRVVVTTLHNATMPLVRYDMGDYAETGADCPCGRGLPVLKRIAGRMRNILITPTGGRVWPFIRNRSLHERAPSILQCQVVQKTRELLEVRLVVSAPLSTAQEQAVREWLLGGLPQGLQLRFAYVDAIPRKANGKFEDFYSEIA